MHELEFVMPLLTSGVFVKVSRIGVPHLRRSGYLWLGTQPARRRRAGLTCVAPTALGGWPRKLDVNRAIRDVFLMPELEDVDGSDAKNAA